MLHSLKIKKMKNVMFRMFAIAILLRVAMPNDEVHAAYMGPSGLNINKTKAVNKAGVMSYAGTILIDTFSVTSATPTVQLGTYIRANGYTKAASYTVTGYKAGATTSNAPNVAVTAFTDTTVSCIITQPNTATVTILGINVLSGLPMILVQTPTDYKLVLSAYLY